MISSKSNIYVIMIVFLFVILSSCGRDEIFQDNFQNGIRSQWRPKTPKKWQLAKEGHNYFYCLREPGQLEDGVRRPAEYLILKDYTFGDFDFKCRLRCDAPLDARYRDVVVIFGYRDDNHFYYVQFSNISDDLHNAIMLVNGNSRTRISKDIPEPTLGDQAFHDVTVKREKDTMEVYYDYKLVMQAEDKTFLFGKLGFGSFDDTASFDDVQIRGKIVSK